MARLSPSEALQRVSSAQQQGMALIAPKNKKSPKFVRAIDENVYLFEKGKGAFVTPAYDNIQPLLGDTSDADLCGQLPPAMEEWLMGYAKEIDWFQNSQLIIDDDDSPQSSFSVGGGSAAANTEQRKSVPYMCKAVYGQKAPYNDTIIINGEKCVTGCWATAVAIIMQHWFSLGYHRGCTATGAYHYSDGWTNNERLPALTVFDIRNIVPKPKTQEEKAAVQQLMKYIGYSCKLKYSKDLTVVSGSVATPYLKSALRLGDSIKYISAAALGAEKFDSAIYNEIVQGRPCIIRGAHADNNGGHFFVADGYRPSDSKYHINWGWDGKCNGHYALSALTPAQGYDYQYYNYATIGIKPDYYLGDVNGDGRVNITDVMVLLEKMQQGDKSIIGDINSDGKINADDWQLIIDTILGKKML